jgi:hypothetical protein
MSKDKGTKNHKKPPADKTSGKTKIVSSYKSESKSAQVSQSSLESFIPKPDQKAGKNKK